MLNIGFFANLQQAKKKPFFAGRLRRRQKEITTRFADPFVKGMWVAFAGDGFASNLTETCPELFLEITQKWF